jgi:hypothetical protein
VATELGTHHDSGGGWIHGVGLVTTTTLLLALVSDTPLNLTNEFATCLVIHMKTAHGYTLNLRQVVIENPWCRESRI